MRFYADTSFLGNLFAVNAGCTHFLSYDAHTRQRALAGTCGLKVFPERLPN